MMHTVRRRWTGLALVAVWALAACTEDPAAVEEGPHASAPVARPHAPVPRPQAAVAGEYDLKLLHGLPLPYFDHRTQENVRSRTLRLNADGTYTQTGEGNSTYPFRYGTFDASGDQVVLRSEVGTELRLNNQAGVLRTSEALAEFVYVLRGTVVPPEYRLRAFSLRTCGGHTPTAFEPCRGQWYDIHDSVAWLSDDGRFYRSDAGVGATARSDGTYTMAAPDSVVFSDARDGWSTRGALRADTLTTGTFVYVALGR